MNAVPSGQPLVREEAWIEPRARRAWWRQLFLVMAGWTILGLFFATQNYLHSSRFNPRPMSWAQVVRSTLPDWYLWAAISPIIVWLSRRVTRRQRPVGQIVAAHLVVGLAIAMLHLVLAVTVVLWLYPPTDYALAWKKTFLFNFGLQYHWNVVTYAAIVATLRSRDFFHMFVAGQTRAWQLESQLAQAQARALQMQVRPHFLFNALNAVAEMIHAQPAQAEEMLLRLADLMRRNLRATVQPEITLEEELVFVRAYLGIESVRFGDRLQVVVDVEPELLAALVPNLVLQALVENAVRHGTSRVAGVGRIEIEARREGADLRVDVRDNGPGLRVPAHGDGAGIGLANTRARLSQMYGTRGVLEIDAGVDGARVRVRLPFRSAHETQLVTDDARAT